MISPKRSLRRYLATAMGERSYILRVEKRKERLESLVECMESPFGAALIEALEDIESAAYGTLATTPVWNWPKLVQAKAEIKIAKYIKAKLMVYVSDLDSINKQLELFNAEESDLEEVDD